MCFFEQDQDWWVSKHIKKGPKSTITCVDWHPNNAIIACGSTDFRVRVFSAFIKEVETDSGNCAWGPANTFQTLLFDFYNGYGMLIFLTHIVDIISSHLLWVMRPDNY